MMRAAREEGANAVEFALLLPILVVIIFGMMWGGIAFEQNLSITHASREAARFGATLDVTGTGTVDTGRLSDIAARAEAAAVGRLDAGGSVNAYVCVAYVQDGHTTRVTNGGTRTEAEPTTLPSEACYDDGIAVTEPRIQVYVERDALLDFIFYGGTIRLTSEAVAFYEHEAIS